MEGGAEERRTAPDGGFYTYQEFFEFYQREDEWYAAPEAMAQQGDAEEWNVDVARANNEHAMASEPWTGEEVDVEGGEDEAGEDEDVDEDEDAAVEVEGGKEAEEGEDIIPPQPEGYYDDDGQWVEPEEGEGEEDEEEEEQEEEEEEEEEDIDWFEELDEDDQEDLTEWLDDFLEDLEVWMVVDGIITSIENYDPERDPIHLDEQSALGFRTSQSVTYVQKFALGKFYKEANGEMWDRKRGWVHFERDPYRSDDPKTWYVSSNVVYLMLMSHFSKS